MHAILSPKVYNKLIMEPGFQEMQLLSKMVTKLYIKEKVKINPPLYSKSLLAVSKGMGMLYSIVFIGSCMSQ